jgi:predicted nucleic acid-binding protein
MRNILVDTGAVVGLLRPGDPAHSRVSAFFTSLKPTDQLLTTWPVVTECAFIMRHRESVFWEWLVQSAIEIVPFELEDVPEMLKWRGRYVDREIDFADTTLVWAGAERGTQLIATTDFDDFETYRLPNGKPFRILIPR